MLRPVEALAHSSAPCIITRDVGSGQTVVCKASMALFQQFSSNGFGKSPSTIWRL
jgi:hypothetical protein